MRKTLIIVGLSFIALGSFFVALPAFRGKEKAAVFFLGHWFDSIWGLAVPCLLSVLFSASPRLRGLCFFTTDRLDVCMESHG